MAINFAGILNLVEDTFDLYIKYLWSADEKQEVLDQFLGTDKYAKTVNGFVEYLQNSDGLSLVLLDGFDHDALINLIAEHGF